jgi:hypothetical protein
VSKTTCWNYLRLLALAAGSVGLFACGGGGSGGDGTTLSYTVGGRASGVDGALVLRMNGATDLTVTANGAFAFPAVADGTAYDVVVRRSPTGKQCSLLNGSGTVAGANVTTLDLACFTDPDPVVTTASGSATITWSNDGAQSYTLYTSSEANFDPATGTAHAGVTSPFTLTGLTDETYTHVVLDSEHAGGHRVRTRIAVRRTALVPNGAVAAMARNSDGTLYLGGTFSAIGSRTGNGVPVNATTGRVSAHYWPEVEGIVRVVLPDDDGGWYIGGEFTRVGGVAREGLAHILASGELDPAWSLDVAGSVMALARSGDVLYVGGGFSYIGSARRTHLAAISTAGAVLDWRADADLPVTALAVGDGTLYVGGWFEQIDGQPRKYLAAIDAQGAVTDWNPSPDVDINTLVVHQGVLYVGGRFTFIGGAWRDRIAAFSAAGTLLDWAPDLDGSGVYKIAAADGVIYFIGDFTTVNGQSRPHVAAVGADGQVRDWNPQVNADVYTLYVHDGLVYLGGAFTQAQGSTRTRLAAVTTAGALAAWAPSAGDAVTALAAQNDMVYVGGAFQSVNMQARSRLAAIDAQGELTDWNPGVAVGPYGGDVGEIVIANNVIYVGGYFIGVGGKLRSNVAALDASGQVLAWAPSVDGGVNAMAVYNDVVYLGGSFTTIDGASRGNLGAVHVDGTLQAWGPATNDRVNTIAIHNGAIYVGGAFWQIGGVRRTFLAKVGTDGVIDSWHPNFDSGVNAIAFADDGTLYVGGWFDNLNYDALDPADQIPRANLAAFDASGTLTTWAPSADNEIRAIAVYNGVVYLGGWFGQIDGATRDNGVAAVAADGTLLAWDPLPATYNSVYALLPTADGILLGGEFTGASGERNFARVEYATP